MGHPQCLLLSQIGESHVKWRGLVRLRVFPHSLSRWFIIVLHAVFEPDCHVLAISASVTELDANEGFGTGCCGFSMRAGTSGSSGPRRDRDPLSIPKEPGTVQLLWISRLYDERSHTR